jgi:uncharacterized protein YjdB
MDASNKTITWSLNTPATNATISSSGMLSVRSACTANEIEVTATANGSLTSISESVTVHIVDPVSSVTLNSINLNLAVGDTESLIPTILPISATQQVTWKSSNPKIATVADGQITALAKGTATITATANDGSGKTASCKVSVVIPVTDMTLVSKNGLTDVVKGKYFYFSATALPIDATNRTFTWSLNVPTTQATISSLGVLYVKSTCTATEIEVTATAKGSLTPLSKTIKVNIVTPVSSIKLNTTRLNLHIGDTSILTTTILPAIAKQEVTWKTSNIKVATVVDGQITMIAKGYAIISATAIDGSGRYVSCYVYVA